MSAGPPSARLLVVPGEGAEALLDVLRDSGAGVEPVAAEPLALGDGPAAIADAIAAYEQLGRRVMPAAALVHGSGDRTLGAAISLVKLDIPVARLEHPDAGADDLAGLLAERRIAADGDLATELSTWLGPILAA